MNGDTLVLNSGSSNIKFALYDGADEQLAILAQGQVTFANQSQLRAKDRHGEILVEKNLDEGLDHDQIVMELFRWVKQLGGSKRHISAVGHRVVHGGTHYSTAVRIDPGVLAGLEKLNPLAPLHQPYNLSGIRVLAGMDPDLVQVACFDTAFHRSMPDVAQRFALPREYHDKDIRRFGFHGLSYEYIASSLPAVMGKDAKKEKVVVAHLGNGASLCALHKGKSVETSMGMTALDGVPMGTRCGNIDPGAILYLQEELGMSTQQVTELLYYKSGLLGVSGISNDMRKLLTSDEPSALEAIDLFVYRINREIAALAASLGGLDALVFTGGIGEHAAPIRARVCELAAWLGLQLDCEANAKHLSLISTAASKISVWVIPTDEESLIAKQTRAVLSGG